MENTLAPGIWRDTLEKSDTGILMHMMQLGLHMTSCNRYKGVGNKAKMPMTKLKTENRRRTTEVGAWRK